MTGCLVWVLLVAAVAFVGSNVGPPYFRYYRYRDSISQRVRFAGARTDSAIRKDIWATADSLDLPEGAYHLNIIRDRGTIHVSGAYDDSWSLFKYTRPVSFTLDLKGSL